MSSQVGTLRPRAPAWNEVGPSFCTLVGRSLLGAGPVHGLTHSSAPFVGASTIVPIF